MPVSRLQKKAWKPGRLKLTYMFLLSQVSDIEMICQVIEVSVMRLQRSSCLFTIERIFKCMRLSLFILFVTSLFKCPGEWYEQANLSFSYASYESSESLASTDKENGLNTLS